jgi:drug/metabolite transporter (DMT)-like permease
MIHPASRPYVWMLCGSFSFSLMAEFAHVLSRTCDWQIIAIARSGLVALFAAALAYIVGARLVFVGPLRLWIRSIAGSCSMLGTFYAFSQLPAADVLTLTNTFPIWVAILSWPLYGTPPSAKMIAAMLLGVVGVGLVEQPHLEAGNLGVFAALGAALFTAVAMLGLHSLKGIDPRAIVVHFSVVATVFCAAAYVVGAVSGHTSHNVPQALAPEILLKLTGLAVTATVGQLLLTLAFRGGAPDKVAVVGLTQIVMALAFDAWLWEREVNAMTIIGTILVIAPTAWLLTRPAPISSLAQPPEGGSVVTIPGPSRAPARLPP